MTGAPGQPACAEAQPHEWGFSLIETLIALAIVASMTAALVNTTAQDARTRQAVQQRRQALMIAQSALDQMADIGAPTGGQMGDYGWQISRQPYGASDPLDRHPLEQLTVAVSASGARGRDIVRLSTVRIKP